MIKPQLEFVHCTGFAGAYRMAYWQWGDAAAAHVIICVHGLTRQGRDFDMLARAMLERASALGQSLRVICPDVVGRGESDWLAEPQNYQYPVYVADSVQLIAHLHAQAAISRLDWVGTSMGGLIGLILAGTPELAEPVPIARLILNDVGPRLSWAALERIGDYVGTAHHFDSVQEGARYLRSVAEGFGHFSDAEWLEFSRPMLRPDEGGGWRLHYDPAIGQAFNGMDEAQVREGEALLWQLYDQIQAHTLLLRGAQTDLLPLQAAQEMQERGPRPQMIEFADVGHAPMFNNREQIDSVLNFLLPVAGGT